MARPQNKHFVKNIPPRGIPRGAFYTKHIRWKSWQNKHFVKNIPPAGIPAGAFYTKFNGWKNTKKKSWQNIDKKVHEKLDEEVSTKQAFCEEYTNRRNSAGCFLYKIQRVKEYEEEVMTKHLRWSHDKTCTMKKSWKFKSFRPC